MSVRELVDLVLDISRIVIWPIVVLVVAFSFRRVIRERISQSEEFSVVGPGGIGLTARGRIEAADALIKASQPTGEIDRETAVEQVGEIVKSVSDFGRTPRILWVDDQPSNNTFERRAMEKLGMAFELSTSTDEALTKIRNQGPYDAIISDMGRPPDERAGYTLLDRLRASGIRTPFIIYAGSRSPEHFDESVRHGAVGCTNRPGELIDLVRRALRAS